MMTRLAGAVAVPVAVKLTGVSDATVAVTVLVPVVWPARQLPTVAMPLPLVAWEAPVSVPPPAVTAKVTATPATGWLDASRTITDGGADTS